MQMTRKFAALVLLSVATAVVAPARASTVAQWRFEGNFEDSSPNNNDLAVAAGSPAFSSTVPPGGFSTQSLSLDGSSHLENTAPANFGFTGDYSVAGWMQLDVDGTAGHRGFFARSPSGGGGSDIEMYIQASSNGFTVAHNRSNGGAFDFIRFPAPPDDTLFHFAFVYEGGTANLFYDGVAQSPNQGWDGSSVVTPPDPAVPVLFAPDNSPLHEVGVGFIDSSFSTVQFPGLLDELFVLDEAITLDQIQNLIEINRLAPVPEPSACGLFWVATLVMVRFSRKRRLRRTG